MTRGLRMSDINVERYLEQLRQKLPHVPPVPVETIRALHKRRDFGGIVRLIRETMNVGVNLTVHWTSGPPPRHLPNAQAWITIPGKVPFYGTPEFKDLRMNVFILKTFRDSADYEEFAITIAHELSHVVLESIHHPLRKEEKAVDLTAMLLGFSLLYRRAAHVIKWVGYNRYREEKLGYLTPGELEQASRLLVPRKLLLRFKFESFARQNPILVGAPILGLLIWAAVTINEHWTAHQTALTSGRSAVVVQSSCAERQRANRKWITSKQAETFCNCYVEEIGNPPTRLQEKIDLVTSRCNHEAFGE
jgi:hypothetical protein